MARILVIDDDRDVVMTLEEVLQVAGYEVRGISTAMETMQQVRLFRPAVLILDLMMPGAHGVSLLESLRKDQDRRLRRLPVIVYSAVPERTAGAWAVAHGAIFIEKPGELAALLASIERALRG